MPKTFVRISVSYATHMRRTILHTLRSAVVLCASSCSVYASAGQAGPPQVPAATSSSSSRISDVLQPSLDYVQENLNSLHVERWKVSGAIRQQMDANVSSIRRNLQSTLPPLLTSADAKPNSITAVLPVFRNVDALYDTYLRLVETALQSAPRQQSSALEEARNRLQDARRSLGDRLQTAAEAQEQRMADVESVLNSRATAAAAPPPPECPTVPAPKKKRRGSV